MPGHSIMVLTLDIYSHVLPHLQEDEARRMAALLEDGEENEGANRHAPDMQGTQSLNKKKLMQVSGFIGRGGRI